MSPASKKTSKKAVTKKTATKKKTAKKAASKTEATKKKVAKKKTVSKKASSKTNEPTDLNLSPEERWRMIAIAAYHRAEKRGFAGGHELEDWTEAEREIDKLLFK